MLGRSYRAGLSAWVRQAPQRVNVACSGRVVPPYAVATGAADQLSKWRCGSRSLCTGKRLRVYTRTGDKGKSSLYTGERRRKDDAVFSALGDTDELNSVVGVARQHCVEQGLVTLDEQLREIQSRLLDAGSAIATPTSSASPDALQRAAFGADHARTLEKWIDAMDLELPTLRNFILPSGGFAAAHLHMARSVCRRAERRVASLVLAGEVPTTAGVFLNRLSDYLFTAARFAALKQGGQETVYQKPDETSV